MLVRKLTDMHGRRSIKRKDDKKISCDMNIGLE